MSNLLRRAGKRFFAFAAALAALNGNAANAQTDPFALPESATAAKALAAAKGPGLSEVEVDGEIRPRLIELHGYGDAMTMDAEDARSIGLPVAGDAVGQVRLASLRLADWKFHTLTQRLTVTLFRNRDGSNLRDLSTPNFAKAPSRNITSFRLAYDASASFQKGRFTPAAALEASLSRGETTAAYQLNIYKTKAVRLDTYVQTRIPGTEIFARIGDYISATSLAQRPLRMAGVQLASSFVNRPDVITTAMPAFSGSVAVPTDVDIITSNQRMEVGKVEPGDYLIRNIPTNMGRGSIDVVLKDALGRQMVRTVSYYRSMALMAPGLDSYAVNAGMIRRNFGLASNDYGAFAASGFWRRGLSPFATLETSAEYSPGIVNVGSRGDFTLGNMALASVELRASSDSRAGSGYLANFSLESVDTEGGASVGLTLPSARYRDVAGHLGDPGSPKQVFANISYRLTPRIPLNLSYVRQHYPATSQGPPRPAREVQMLTLSSSIVPFRGAIVSFQGGMRAEPRRSIFANLSLSVPLGPRHTVSAASRTAGGVTENSLGYLFNDKNPFGVHAEASVSRLAAETRVAGLASLSTRHVEVQGAAAFFNETLVAQGSIRGSLIAVGNATYARNTSANGYALVRTGDVGNIPVSIAGRAVGKTDRSGRLLVSDLSTRVPLKLAIDDTGLPLDALVLTTTRTTKLFPGSVGLVEFDTRRFRPVVRTILDAAGNPVSAGLGVTAFPSRTNSLVGYEGTVEINAAGGDRYLEVYGGGQTCRVDLPVAAELENGTAPLACRPLTIAEAGERALARRKVARRD